MRSSVLHLIGNLHQGGSERQALLLAQLLRASDRYDVHLACLDKQGVLLREAEQMGFDDITEYPLTSFWDRNALAQVRRFASDLRERRIDIIQTHDFYSNILGMAAAKLAGVSVRIAARRETLGCRTRMQLFVERRAYNLAHAIVANSEAVRRQLHREGVADRKIVTIYNGIEASRYVPVAEFNREEALASFGLPAESRFRYVTLVANLRHTVKDHPTFLRAAERVSREFPDARFVIAGEGELTASMQDLAAHLGIASRMFFIGRCAGVAQLLAASDVCVLSSKAEGFSNSILEYMAAARPAVVTDVGGAREAVIDGATGYVVDAQEPERMSERILTLLKNPEQAGAMGERGRSIVENKFSCEAQLAATEALYERLLSRRTKQTGRYENSETVPNIRVLIAAPSLAYYGGQALLAARLIEHLNQEPMLDVRYQPHDPTLPKGLRWLRRIKYVRTVVATLAYTAMLLCRVWRYDVVHVFSASYYSYLLSAVPALLVGKLYARRTILHYHSGEAEDHLARWRTAGPTMKWADRIIVPSGYLVEVFARFGLHAEAIFNTVELDRFRFRERHSLQPNFVSTRLLEPLYNVACALRAFALIQKRYPEARLIVAAAGSERSNLEQLASELELRNVEFMGKVDYERMPAVLDAADIYLNANDVDNMPSSLIECMAAGVSIVTTKAGGIPYIISHERTGLLVDCNDHVAMAASAMRLLEVSQLGVTIASRARLESQKYRWLAVRDQWSGLYGELASTKKPRVGNAGVKSVPGDLL